MLEGGTLPRCPMCRAELSTEENGDANVAAQVGTAGPDLGQDPANENDGRTPDETPYDGGSDRGDGSGSDAPFRYVVVDWQEEPVVLSDTEGLTVRDLMEKYALARSGLGAAHAQFFVCTERGIEMCLNRLPSTTPVLTSARPVIFRDEHTGIRSCEIFARLSAIPLS